MLRSSLGDKVDRRVADAIDTLERRKEPRSFYVTVDFGSVPTTSAQLEVNGLSWLKSSHVVQTSPTSLAQLTASLRSAATSITPGRGFMLTVRTSSNLTGAQRLGVVVV